MAGNSGVDPGDLIVVAILLGVLGAGGLFISGGDGGANPIDGEKWAENWGYECLVQAVPSGDQLLCNDSTSVRLIGMDAPETAYGEVAETARRALASIAPPGGTVGLELDTLTDDRFGRVYGYVRIADGQLANALMVEAGYAVYENQAPNRRYTDALRRAERVGRVESRGLWTHSVFQCFAAGRPSAECSDRD